MIEIMSINTFSGGYIVNYVIPAPCGCSFTRHSLIMSQKQEPTKEQALTAIQNEIRNKR